MTIIRNKSGAPSSLFSIGAINVPDDGDFDLSTVVAGQPLVLEAKAQGQGELRAALVSGEWCVVSGGAELGTQDSVAALMSSSERELDQRASQRETGTLASYVSNAPEIIRAWPIGEGEQITVVLQCFDIVAPVSLGRTRGGAWTGLGKAGRDGASAPTMIGETTDKAENLSRDSLGFRVEGNTMVLEFAARIPGTPNLNWILRYFIERQPNP